MFKRKQSGEKPPKPPSNKVAYKFRCYPNSTARQYLETTLSACRELYNACLEERKEAHTYWVRWHKDNGTPFQWPNYLDQQNQLPEMKQGCEEYQQIAAHVLQDVCQRVNRTGNAIWRESKPTRPFQKVRRKRLATHDIKARSNTTPVPFPMSLDGSLPLAISKQKESSPKRGSR